MWSVPHSSTCCALLRAQVEITGKRIAYSAHGTVVSLNGAPEGNVAVEALAVRNDEAALDHHLEETVETVTEADGTYRLRGAP